MSDSPTIAAGAARRILPALLLLAAAAGLVALLSRAGIPMTDARASKDYGDFAIGLAAALLATRLVDFTIFDLGYRVRRAPAAPELLRQLVSLLIFGFLLGLLFKVLLSVSLPALLTTSAIITAVVGLALQETLGNLFSGIALAIEHTLQVGDMVRTGDTIGLVEQLSWRAIKVRTMEGNSLLIPNSVASRDRLEVFRRGHLPMARTLKVGLEYDASPNQARALLESAARDVPGVAALPAPVAYLAAFHDFSVSFELRYWLDDYARYLEVDSRVRERVWYRLERAGLAFAYPVIRQHQYAFGPPRLPDHAKSVLEAIEANALFAPLSPEERRRLAAGARLLVFSEGETVVREGDSTSSMFLIASGRAAVSLHGTAGSAATSRKLALLEPGAAFGEISLLTGEPRLASVRALTEATLVEIDKATLAPVLQANPSLVEKLDKIILERRRSTASHRATAGESAPAEEQSLRDKIARFFGLKGV
ncbi:MAG TPA: mechanosensitive ion channel family protein [Thermoanaerobaculia bacterium]|jgi:small-conductance mechanosensitive channel/CRP-like cAMP-binding protein|nr:mechanosensitive ion channel family protein [Thermoanaerobaculia bacterium]